MQTLRPRNSFPKIRVQFDYLIAGFGSEPAFFDIPGIEENAFTLWSLEDAEKLHDHILNMFRKASEEKIRPGGRQCLPWQ